MSEPQPKAAPTSAQTIKFMVILSFACALILSLLASALAKPKELAKDLDRSQQMMIAAKILNHQGYFTISNEEGQQIIAKYEQGGYLVPGTEKDFPPSAQILEIYNKRLIPLLVDKEGKVFTFEEAKLNEDEYVAKNKKTGYHKESYKLIYKILPNSKEAGKVDIKKIEPEGWVIPVNGYGLWDAIYGYLAIQPDGDTIIGITWYDQKETPGLGANIAEPYWQDLFPGKKIFQESPSGKTDFQFAPLGIVVIRGKVSDVYGDAPKSKSAVDGMTGATLTGNGVTDAYRDVLSAYRPFLMRLHQEYLEKKKP